MTVATTHDTRAEALRERVLAGAAELLAEGGELTFGAVAKASGVPERTVYRHFETREGLLTALFHWANRRIGFDGTPPVDEDSATALVRKAFSGFDGIAPVVRELLAAPAGLGARLTKIEDRRRAALALVKKEVPDLDRRTHERVAAALSALGTAATWQTLRDYWGLDGKEAGETAALAIELVLAGARSKTKKRKAER